MSSLLKFLIIFSLSSVKFLIAPPLSFGMGLNYFQTVASTSAGGIMGVLLFFYMSRVIIRMYDQYIRSYVHDAVHYIAIKVKKGHIAERYFPSSRIRRKFTFSNRLFVRVRKKYGFIGIVILTPVLFSIPVGSFLAARFYSNRQYAVLYLSASVLIWSLLMSSAIAIF
ncbi:MAG: hypothetical protein IPH88_09410 [Bacteroidales bacterium]|nr:hypothetical protein [Bacteroidales bacterium]